LNFLPS